MDDVINDAITQYVDNAREIELTRATLIGIKNEQYILSREECAAVNRLAELGRAQDALHQKLGGYVR